VAAGEKQMQIIQNLAVPTGNILVVEGAKGKLEMLSLADYGQGINLNQHKPVPNGLPLMPLTEKWVVTVSTQYGCSMGCEFCDVPKVGAGRNATFHDLCSQILTALTLPGVPSQTNRLNIHFARMGEPSWNPAVLDCGKWIAEHLGDTYNPHPVVSTMMPRRNEWLKTFVHTWMRLKNRVYKGNAGLQLSINSTDETERKRMFSDNACTLEEIADIMRGIIPVGRKITLNFAVAGYAVDTEKLARLFSPELYVVKLTPMHKTAEALQNGIETEGDYTTPEPYLELEERLKKSGFETLVFIASEDEDKGRITCGNAILSGTLPECQYEDRTSCAKSAQQYIKEQAGTSHNSAMLQGLKPHAGGTGTSA
jgi:23S rRNA (adenine2503-C2)-methyltransferase